MSKKALSVEQREKKNARARARYNALRKLGLTSTQARKPVQAVKESPSLFKKVSKVVRGLAKTLGIEETQRKSGRRDYSDFEKFARKNKDLSANKIIQQYTALGKKVGKQKAYEIVRTVKGKERDVSKIHTIKYRSNNKYKLYDSEIRKRYMKERYMYLMRYDLEREGWIEPESNYVTIASPGKLDFETLVNETITQWEESQTNDRKERYHALRIIEDSIVLIRAVDTDMK